MMIKRIWRGWTGRDHADAYEALLTKTIVPGIGARAIGGLQAIEVLRRNDSDPEEVEFMTIMTFEGWAAVEAFAGADPTAAVVPESARRLMTRFDQRSAHYVQIS